MTNKNGMCQRVLDELQACGPMTAAELNQHLKETKHRIAAATSRLRRAHLNTPKRIHVTTYVFDHEGQRCYPRPVFALGDKPDARRPKPDKKASFKNKRSSGDGPITTGPIQPILWLSVQPCFRSTSVL